jgi:hypothetical protein
LQEKLTQEITSWCTFNAKWSDTHQLTNHVNHLGGDLVIRVWDQEVCFICVFRFKLCGCLYDGHWKLTWSLISRPVELVEVRISWPEKPH